MSNAAAPAPPARWLTWARLCRLPNVFSAFADIFLGYAAAATLLGRGDVASLVLLAASSGALYISGMIGNDVSDLEVDRVERPGRPLPSGVISPRSASVTALTLMALGCLAAAVVNTACLAVAVLLCLCIIGYNGLLKSTVLGPVAMGACRFLNVTLAIAGVWGGLEVSSNLPAALWLIPLGNGVYITGVTWFARQEATTSSRGSLSAAAFTLSGGLAIHAYTIAMFGRFDVAWIAAVLFTGVVVYRIATAIRDPSPQRVQSAIKTFVLGLAALDAVLATAFVGPLYGLAILFLLLPAFVLGRWIYST